MGADVGRTPFPQTGMTGLAAQRATFGGEAQVELDPVPGSRDPVTQSNRARAGGAQ